MNARSILWSVLFASLVAGCGSDGTNDTTNDLTKAGKKLIGAYVDDSGRFQGLVLTSEAVSSNANRFFADIYTGIMCTMGPCPTIVRVEGTFTAGKKTITLKADTADFDLQIIDDYMGKYSYKLSDEGKFSLSRDEEHETFSQSLELVDSYCTSNTAITDCSEQNVAQPKCPGSWECSAESSCTYSCGDSRAFGVQCDDNLQCASGQCVEINEGCGEGDAGVCQDEFCAIQSAGACSDPCTSKAQCVAKAADAGAANPEAAVCQNVCFFEGAQLPNVAFECTQQIED